MIKLDIINYMHGLMIYYPTSPTSSDMLTLATS
jgi:hypothetical protein